MIARSSCSPVDAVVRQQGAAVAFFQPLGQQERTGLRYALQQSVAAEAPARLLIVELPEDRRVSGGFELGENVFQKVHVLAKPPPCLSRKRRD